MWSEVQGRKVLVLGSAPSASLPSSEHYDFTIAVSGAIALLPSPDIWLINYHTMRANTPARLKTVSHYSHRVVQRLVLLDHRVPMRQRLDAWMVEHSVKAFCVSRLTREARVLALQRAGYTIATTPSSGMMAVCFAFLSGASSVVMSGFSTEHGHFYDPAAQRIHVREDQALYSLLKRRYNLIGGFRVPA